MRNWRPEFEAKLTTAEEAVSCVKSGDLVVLGLKEPLTLCRAMVARTDLERVTVLDVGIRAGGIALANAEPEGRFTLKTGMVHPLSRGMVKEGRAEYLPVAFSELCQTISRFFQPDVAMVQLTPPDDNGYCSLSFAVDFTKSVISAARQCGKPVIAEIVESLPYTYGDSLVHVSEIDLFVYSTEQPVIRPSEPEPEAAGAVAANVAALVDDGATIQIGIGAVPNGVARRLLGHKDLGIHTEVFADGLRELMERGVANGRMKTIHRGKAICTLVQGPQEMFTFIHRNPDILLYPADYVLDPRIIAQNYKMTSINSAMQVDLVGQVNAESIGLEQYSGAGGQLDFFRGANMAADGKAIIAVESTAGNGKYSRIVNALDPGAIVTSPRCDVRFVVTEYGVAYLQGKTTRERARTLIDIAHPKFREELERQARARGLRV